MNLNKIATSGEKYYQGVKNKYEPKYIDKVLAINSENKLILMGNNGIEVMSKIHKKYPGMKFYLRRVGNKVYETIYKQGGAEKFRKCNN